MTVQQRVAVSESSRKLVHIAFGFVAFSLRFLSWHQALLLAAAAMFHNRFVLPLWGRRIARTERGHDVGILIYPTVVFLLILIFRDRPWIAASVWGLLAFGDGLASLVGRNIASRALPWNRRKSLLGLLAHLEAGIPMAALLALWTGVTHGFIPWPVLILVGGVVAAIVESLPLGFDDNLTQTAAAAFTIAFLDSWVRLPPVGVTGAEAVWLLVNVLLAAAGYLARSVSLSGAVAGTLLGSALIAWGGWPAYVVLLLFFVLGSAATRMGWREKKTLGLEQEGEGRRGASHAFANAGAAVICICAAVATDASAGLMWLAAVAALATATADTVSSEIGQWIGRRAFLPLTFRRVERGTEGAISLEGTVAGALGAFVVAAAGMLLLAWKSRGFETLPFSEGWTRAAHALSTPFLWKGIAIVAVSAVAAAWLESVAGSWNRNRIEKVPNGAMNFLNTVAGAVIAIALATLLGYEI